MLELEASRSKLEEVENELGAFKVKIETSHVVIFPRGSQTRVTLFLMNQEKNTEISTEIVELGKKLAKKDQLEKVR